MFDPATIIAAILGAARGAACQFRPRRRAGKLRCRREFTRSFACLARPVARPFPKP